MHQIFHPRRKHGHFHLCKLPIMGQSMEEHGCFVMRTLIYPPPCEYASRKKWDKMNTRQQTIGLILLIVIALTLTPTLASADDHHQSRGNITITTSGTATPIGHDRTSGSPANATLVLSGSIFSADQYGLSFFGLTGNLHIGQTTYPISNGQGQSNSKGKLEIHAQTNSTGKNSNGNQNNDKDHLELVLHGSLQGSNVAFDAKQSELASIAFLSLSGRAEITLFTTTTSGNTSTVTVTVTQTVGQSLNNTVTATVVSNQTVTVGQPVTTTVFGPNITTTILQPNVTTTILESVTTTVLEPSVTTTIVESGATVTVTVTSTVANATITQTITASNQSTTSTAT